MSDATLHDAVAAATRLAPHICAVREELETTRRVPPALVQAIHDAGLFRPYLPRAMGGLELPPLTVFRVIEEISKVDGAVGWCTMIASSVSFFSGWLHPEIGRAMFGQPPDVRVAGSLRPEGQAYPVDGGYRIRGRWDFASGITHANWLLCTCTMMDGDTPRQTPTGVPETRSMLIPAEQATIVDTWSVLGMCGTGSHDFIVDDVFVPAAHSFSLLEPPQAPGPLYHPRLIFVVLWTGTVANALGMARGAMDAFIELATEARSTSSSTLLRDRALVQTQVAEAEAILSAARAYVLASVGAAWEAVCAGVPDPSHVIAQARLAITHSMHEAVRVVDRVFHAAGTNAIYRKYGLERYFRDVHTAVQHAAGLPVHIESAGKVFLGLRPHDLGW
ncbi:MAG TPA: acyl-CoA dehydrogenase family protein [Candidatus Tectomicrobia bacterium]